MMAKAIGPQNRVGAIGMRPSTVDSAVNKMGRKRPVAADTTASCTVRPLRSLVRDLDKEDDRVLRYHADERQNPQDCYETEGPSGEQERTHHSDQTEGQQHDHQQGVRETSELNH